MQLNVDNCPRCGRLFQRGFLEVCAVCQKEIEKQYELCFHYLRENRGATIHELSEETGVSIRQITKFIREGRISLMDAPNMTYPCEVCGTLIRTGGMCDSCRERLSRDVRYAAEDAVKEEEKRREALKSSYNINEGLDKRQR